MNSFRRPESYAGSCIVCLYGTDTALAFVGSLEWKAAGLIALRIPEDEALGMIDKYADGDEPMFVRVCAECVKKSGSGLPRPQLVIPDASIPAVHEPLGPRRGA